MFHLHMILFQRASLTDIYVFWPFMIAQNCGRLASHHISVTLWRLVSQAPLHIWVSHGRVAGWFWKAHRAEHSGHGGHSAIWWCDGQTGRRSTPQRVSWTEKRRAWAMRKDDEEDHGPGIRQEEWPEEPDAQVLTGTSQFRSQMTWTALELDAEY